MIRYRLAPTVGILAAILLAAPVPAGPPHNTGLPTLGGTQLWSDEYFHAGWRIQTNVRTGRYRLLDPDDRRRARGTYADCRTAFEQMRRKQDPAYRSKRLVILIHGLGRSSGMFDDLAARLRADGFETAAVSYASTRQGIAAHARHLARLVAGIEGIEEVSFVTHSMGGLVVRALFAQPELQNVEARFGRLVMIAPPNQGSAIARALAEVSAYRWLTTDTGRDLTPARARNLPAPPIPFAIIAGGRGDGIGYNPFLGGDDDGIVTVAETRLPGARDFLVVNSPHGLVDNDDRAIDAVRRFLACGSFSCASAMTAATPG